MKSGRGGCPLQAQYEKWGGGGEGVVHFRPDMKMGGGGGEGGGVVHFRLYMKMGGRRGVYHFRPNMKMGGRP